MRRQGPTVPSSRLAPVGAAGEDRNLSTDITGGGYVQVSHPSARRVRIETTPTACCSTAPPRGLAPVGAAGEDRNEDVATVVLTTFPRLAPVGAAGEDRNTVASVSWYADQLAPVGAAGEDRNSDVIAGLPYVSDSHPSARRVRIETPSTT